MRQGTKSRLGLTETRKRDTRYRRVEQKPHTCHGICTRRREFQLLLSRTTRKTSRCHLAHGSIMFNTTFAMTHVRGHGPSALAISGEYLSRVKSFSQWGWHQRKWLSPTRQLPTRPGITEGSTQISNFNSFALVLQVQS